MSEERLPSPSTQEKSSFPESIGKIRVREDPAMSYHLGILIVYLNHLCSHSKKSANETQTHFHSMYEPQLSVAQYVDRVGRYARCTQECFIVALILLDRYQTRTRNHISVLNAHRLIITSLLVAAKSRDDVFQSNEYYNRLGGLPESEINHLERCFLTDIDFMTYIPYKEYNWYLFQLSKIAPNYFLYNNTLLRVETPRPGTHSSEVELLIPEKVPSGKHKEEITPCEGETGNHHSKSQEESPKSCTPAVGEKKAPEESEEKG